MNELIENKKKSEILAESISLLSYESVITHNEISRIIHEPYPSTRYNSTVSKAKKILLKQHHKSIESIRGDGYRVIHPDNFVDASLKHYKRGFNEMQKGADTLKYAPVADMTEEGRITYRRVHDRAVILQASMKGASVELKTLAERNHPFRSDNVNRR